MVPGNGLGYDENRLITNTPCDVLIRIISDTWIVYFRRYFNITCERDFIHQIISFIFQDRCSEIILPKSFTPTTTYNVNRNLH